MKRLISLLILVLAAGCIGATPPAANSSPAYVPPEGDWNVSWEDAVQMYHDKFGVEGAVWNEFDESESLWTIGGENPCAHVWGNGKPVWEVRQKNKSAYAYYLQENWRLQALLVNKDTGESCTYYSRSGGQTCAHWNDSGMPLVDNDFCRS